MIDDHAAGAVEPLRLMNEHVTSSVIRVVGDAESFWNLSVFGVCVQRFDNLRRFGSRRGAHVENGAVRFYVEQQRWNHRNELLARDVAALALGDHPLVEARQLRELAQLLPAQIRLPGEPVHSCKFGELS